VTASSRLLELLERAVGLYGTSPASYLSLLARADDFELSDLDRALYRDRSVARVRCMRGSLYMLPLDVVGVAAPATQEQHIRGLAPMVAKTLATSDYETWAARVDESLGEGPLSASDIAPASLLPTEGMQTRSSTSSLSWRPNGGSCGQR